MLSQLSELTRVRSRIIVEALRQGGIMGFTRLVRRKLRQYLLLSKSLSNSQQYVLVPEVNGFTIMVNASDAGIGRELRKYRVHEPILTRLLASFIHCGDVVLDIGANIGYYSLLFSRWVGSQGLVIAVEPEPNNFALLELNLRLNKVNNVHPHRFAISDQEGNATLFVSDYSNWHSLRSKKPSTVKEIDVPTKTIDAIAKEISVPLSLIRMDIEGFEDRALRGAQETLRKNKPRLFMEVHPTEFGSADEVRNMLLGLANFGYEVRFLVLRGDDYPWVRRRRVWCCSLKFLLSNEVLLEGPEAFVLMLEATSQ